ncbi:MAG: DUF3592 domain-containing protein [Rhizobacter sp.]|nr:DUF3592 domain-containing protein [Rhizobacter sp.]
MSLVLVASLLFLLLPVGAGVALISNHRKLMRNTRRANGKTLAPREHADSFDDTYFTSVVEYSVDGVRYVIEADGISNFRWCHRAGRDVQVYFPPEKPNAGKLLHWWLPALYWLPILLAGYVAFILLYASSR